MSYYKIEIVNKSMTMTTARSRTDVARNVSTMAGMVATAFRLNCDFKMINLIHMILLNHENHFNHIKITVQTNDRFKPNTTQPLDSHLITHNS
jgi:hypothetical protein